MKMATECTQCGKTYQINVDGIDTQFVKFNCQECQTENILENPHYAEHDIPVSDDLLEDYSPDQFDDAVAGLDEEEEESSFWEKFSLGTSIRTRIIAVFVALVLVSLSVVGWVASARSRAALSNQAEASLELYANQKAREYGLSFERIQQEVEAIADYAKELYENPRDPVDMNLRQHVLMPWNGKGYGGPQYERELRQEVLIAQQLVPLLVHIVKKDPYSTLGYLGTETRLMIIDDPAAVTSIGSRVGYENTKRPWYIQAKAAGKTIWTEPYVDADTQELIVTCATPVVANGQLVGVAAYDVLLATIQKDILTLNIGYNSYAFLVDKDGKALVRPGMKNSDTRWDKTYETDDLLHTSNQAYNNIISKMTAGQSGVDTYGSEEGDKYLAYAPLPAISASMGIVASKREVVKPALAIQRLIMYVWLAVLVLAIGCGLYIGNGITRPINHLTDAADRISRGEMDLEMLDEGRRDEIGRLTKAFNRLVTSLKIAMSVH